MEWLRSLEVDIIGRVVVDNWKAMVLERTWLRILKLPVIIKEQFGESYCESGTKIEKLKEEVWSLVDDYNKECDEEYCLMRRDPMCKGFRKKQRIVWK